VRLLNSYCPWGKLVVGTCFFVPALALDDTLKALMLESRRHSGEFNFSTGVCGGMLGILVTKTRHGVTLLSRYDPLETEDDPLKSEGFR